MAEVIVVVYTIEQQFRVQFYGAMTIVEGLPLWTNVLRYMSAKR